MNQRTPPDSSHVTLFKGTMVYSGAHYSRCPVEIRELWAQGFALPEGPETLKKLIAEMMGDPTAEMVVISTCNRFDVCLFGNLNKEKVGDVFVQFADWTLEKLPHLKKASHSRSGWLNEVQSWLRTFTDEQAIQHLFRVGASLDSLVLGEPHILGQLKDAFQSAVDAGHGRQEATLAFNRAFQVAKKIRTETDLGRNGISIGHAAVDIVQRVFEDLGKHSCLILGAGEMAKITAQHLHSCGAGAITIANRTLSKAQALSAQIPQGRAIALHDGLALIGEFDVIVAATSAQDFILRKELHSNILGKRKIGTPCVLVDISVPRNIDPELGGLKNIFVFDVDDLDKIMDSSRKAREKAAHDAEVIVRNELSEFISHRKQRENLVNVGLFHMLVKDVVEKEIVKSLRSPDGLTDDQIKITADAVAKKLVAHPALLARTDARLDTDKDSIGEVLKYLFNLEHNKRG